MASTSSNGGTSSRVIAVDKRTWVQGRPAGYSVAGQGMPVVLLHGWALAQHTYRDVVERIASQGCRVIAPSMPGFGGTHDLPDHHFSLGGYAAWVDDLLTALEIDEPAVVVGHSFGGGVAIRLAHDHPERVRSLVLVNSVGGSAWKRGSKLRSIAERPLWDWGLHFPSDVWPIRQATRVLPVIAEDLLPNLVRHPRAIVKVANLPVEPTCAPSSRHCATAACRSRSSGPPATASSRANRSRRCASRRVSRAPWSRAATAGCSPTPISSAR